MLVLQLAAQGLSLVPADLRLTPHLSRGPHSEVQQCGRIIIWEGTTPPPPPPRTTRATTSHPKLFLLLLEQEVLKMNTAGNEGMKISSLKEERTASRSFGKYKSKLCRKMAQTEKRFWNESAWRAIRFLIRESQELRDQRGPERSQRSQLRWDREDVSLKRRPWQPK